MAKYQFNIRYTIELTIEEEAENEEQLLKKAEEYILKSYNVETATPNPYKVISQKDRRTIYGIKKKK